MTNSAMADVQVRGSSPGIGYAPVGERATWPLEVWGCWRPDFAASAALALWARDEALRRGEPLSSPVVSICRRGTLAQDQCPPSLCAQVAGLQCDWIRAQTGRNTPDGRFPVNEDRAQERLRAERAEIKAMLPKSEAAVDQDRSAENEQGDADDRAQPLTAEGIDDSLAESLRDRLAALDRAEQRLRDGTYGLSIRSGIPIADERLDADPAAELTIDEARGE